MESISLAQILISIATSVVGGLILIKYTKYRERQIKRQIEELENFEEFAQKLGKGTAKLLRTSFVTLFICMTAFFTSCMSLVLAYLFQDYFMIKYTFCIFALSGLFVACYLAFMQVKAIYYSSNQEDAKKSFAEKKAKLQAKIS